MKATTRFFSALAIFFLILGFGLVAATMARAADITITSNVECWFEYQTLGILSGQPDPAGWQNYIAPGYQFKTPRTLMGENGTDPPGGQRIVVYPPVGYAMADPILTGTELVGDKRDGNIIQFSNDDPAGQILIELVFEEIPPPPVEGPRVTKLSEGRFQLEYLYSNESQNEQWIYFWAEIDTPGEPWWINKKHPQRITAVLSGKGKINPGEEEIFNIPFYAKEAYGGNLKAWVYEKQFITPKPTWWCKNPKPYPFWVLVDKFELPIVVN